MNINYFSELGQSWKLLWKNPVLFIPPILGGAVGTLLLSLAVIILMVHFLVSLSDFVSVIGGDSSGIDRFTALPGFVTTLVVLVVLLVPLLFFINIFIRAMELGMRKEVCLTGTTSAATMMASARKYFLPLLKLQLFSFFFLFLLPAALLAVPAVAGLLLELRLFAIIYGVLISFLFLAYLLFLSFGLFFAPVMITLGERQVIPLVRRSFSYSMKHPAHVLATFGVMALVSFGMVVLFLLLLPLVIVLALIPLGFIIPGILRWAIQVVLSVFLQLYVFKSYFAANPAHGKGKEARHFLS